MSTVRVMLAEAIGTFFLCFAGIAAILSTGAPIESGVGLVGIALAHGFALAVAVNAFGGVSGAHFNPAVTIAMLVVGRIRSDRAVQYILAQIAGATIAAWACQSFFPLEVVNDADLGIPLPGPLPGAEGAWVTVRTLLGVEFVLTFLLVTAIFGTAVDTRGQGVKIGGFGIGLTVAFNILACGKVTGASMNPARSFGPALVHKLTGGTAGAAAFDYHWCYWLAPVAGAIVAALVYEKMILGSGNDG
ncbi:MAG TPA: MIP/aquaporin family protein [Lacipirellulaceae bacterium]|nr:MIP/aquaporin family protein [Lacipirellulaceae bacterium]